MAKIIQILVYYKIQCNISKFLQFITSFKYILTFGEFLPYTVFIVLQALYCNTEYVWRRWPKHAGVDNKTYITRSAFVGFHAWMRNSFQIYHSLFVLLFRFLRRKTLLFSEFKGTIASFCKLNLPEILGVALDNVRGKTQVRQAEEK